MFVDACGSLPCDAGMIALFSGSSATENEWGWARPQRLKPTLKTGPRSQR